jgi:hypothetical protein
MFTLPVSPYELARKHCGKQDEWKISLELLHKKTSLAGSLVLLRIARDMEYTDDSWKQIWNKTRTSLVIGY